METKIQIFLFTYERSQIMKFEKGKLYHGFRLQEVTEVRELNAVTFLFEHDKSGARLLYLQNDDDNKVFSIAFRTPPPDSTGLPHILEHSVLCGSGNFREGTLCGAGQGSLNILNATAYPDKTIYPVASRNDKILST